MTKAHIKPGLFRIGSEPESEPDIVWPPRLFDTPDVYGSRPLLVQHLIINPFEIAAAIDGLKPFVEGLKAELSFRVALSIKAGNISKLALDYLGVHKTLGRGNLHVGYRGDNRQSGSDGLTPGTVFHFRH